ncbi:MAG: hypothetical protein VW397_02355, partial [Candidatus Margulisiibacteriota bacterium]
MKKRLIIFFITALLMTLTYKTLLTPHLIPTTNRILDKIVKQEAAKDCTCWSTVRIMEFHQAKLPLSYDAMAIKIEVMKTLLWEIWFSASQQDQPFNKAIEEI